MTAQLERLPDTMAPVVERRGHVQFPCTVVAVQDLGPQLRRVTLSAPELRDFVCSGPDEYFGLMMPPTVAGVLRPLVIPDEVLGNVRDAIAALPADQRPDLRWYTVAAHRPHLGEVDADIVIHGDAGPGSAWARLVQVGDRVGFRSGGALYRPPAGGADLQLLVADETALPSLRAIVAHWQHAGTTPARALIHLEVASIDGLGPLELPVGTVVHERGSAAPGSVVLPALAARPDLEVVDYAWLCGESGMVTRARRHLVMERALPRRAVLFSGYWKLGAARG